MSVSGAVFAVKGALTAMTDERVRTAVLSVTAAICIPFFLIISVMLCSLSGTADHNRQAVFLSFYGSGISLKMPEEYRSYIRDMQESFQDMLKALDIQQKLWYCVVLTGGGILKRVYLKMEEKESDGKKGKESHTD